MKDQLWDLNQTWPVGRKWCRFTNAPKNFGAALPQIWGAQNIKFGPFFATSALDTAYLRNETSHRQTKNAIVSICNVSLKSWSTFRDLWSKNGWDPFSHFDPPFGRHYVATIKVVTCL